MPLPKGYRALTSVDFDLLVDECRSQGSLCILPCCGRDGKNDMAVIVCDIDVAMAVRAFVESEGTEWHELPPSSVPANRKLAN